MQLETKHFGMIEIKEGEIVNFSDGMPGFEKVKQYILIGTGDDKSPFKWLQSVDEPTVAFAVVNPFLIKKDYDFELSDKMIKSIELDSENDVQVYSIVVVPEDTKKITMNLKAPVIINTKSLKGMQVVLDTDRYTVRHYILEELRRQEVVTDVSINEKKGTINNNK